MKTQEKEKTIAKIKKLCKFIFFPCHSQFDYEVYTSINFYMSYFHYDRENDTHSSKSNRNVKEFENNFLIFCRYLNLVKHEIIILYQIENSQVVAILKFCTGFWRKK